MIFEKGLSARFKVLMGKHRLFFCLSVIVPSCLLLFIVPKGFSQQDGEALPGKPAEKLRLLGAEMCEAIQDYCPQNQGIVFSTTVGEILCYTSFDPVPEKTVIYHSWFYKNRLITRAKLSLEPPRWSTFSKIELREADKGPWRVEITDVNGSLLKVLRFSVTD